MCIKIYQEVSDFKLLLPKAINIVVVNWSKAEIKKEIFDEKKKFHQN